MYKLKRWINIKNIDWRILSQNPNAIDLLHFIHSYFFIYKACRLLSRTHL